MRGTLTRPALFTTNQSERCRLRLTFEAHDVSRLSMHLLRLEDRACVRGRVRANEDRDRVDGADDGGGELRVQASIAHKRNYVQFLASGCTYEMTRTAAMRKTEASIV